MKSHGDMTWTSGLIPMIEPEIVTEIISRITDLALVLSSEGRVLGVLSNPSFKARLGLSRWEGRPLRSLLTVESVAKFEARLETFLEDRRKEIRPVELNHCAMDGQPEFPVRYSFHHIGTDGAILLLGQDLRPVAEMQQQLVAAQIALEKDYEAQREYDTRLRVLMSTMEEGALFVSAPEGRIVECNGAAARMLGSTPDALIGKLVGDQMEGARPGHLIEDLIQRATVQQSSRAEVRTRIGGRTLSLRPTLFRTAGAQMLLCHLGRDDTAPAAADGLGTQLEGLFAHGADAIVFMSPDGNVLSANDAFLRLANVTHATALRDRPLADFLGRGSVDLNVIRDNAERTGAMRHYATRLVGEHGAQTPVEIATTHIRTGATPIFALVIRDAGRSAPAPDTGGRITDVNAQSVVELIGSHTLKGIVARTTDVIEKMCIETAVELTSNNRVAAAEMLGLSRQSLYVKLRKYDLLKKDATD